MIKVFIDLPFTLLDNMNEKDKTTYHIISWVVIVLIVFYFI